MTSLQQRLTDVYQRLLSAYGPQRWWPADGPFEVIVGAILTQSTAWANVEKAVANLRTRGLLEPAALHMVATEELARLVRPAGYYNAKARKVKAFLDYLWERYRGDLQRCLAREGEALREELLGIYGIGEETADSIVLYAAHQPTFVVDAYTRRIIKRLGVAPSGESYGDYQALFMENLPASHRLFNEYHALLVQHGKQVCRKVPLCAGCCLGGLCPTYRGAGRADAPR